MKNIKLLFIGIISLMLLFLFVSCLKQNDGIQVNKTENVEGVEYITESADENYNTSSPEPLEHVDIKEPDATEETGQLPATTAEQTLESSAQATEEPSIEAHDDNCSSKPTSIPTASPTPKAVINATSGATASLTSKPTASPTPKVTIKPTEVTTEEPVVNPTAEPLHTEKIGKSTISQPVFLTNGADTVNPYFVMYSGEIYYETFNNFIHVSGNPVNYSELIKTLPEVTMGGKYSIYTAENCNVKSFTFYKINDESAGEIEYCFDVNRVFDETIQLNELTEDCGKSGEYLVDIKVMVEGELIQNAGKNETFVFSCFFKLNVA